ncbi:MAG: lamin tail domain-containing protein [Chloroflexaceae bacterium]|nr:lamin tail domain-containing protein [Chloroflexaceae bacterium]
MAAPASGEVEWVELFNPNSYAVTLEGWMLQRTSGTDTTSTRSLAKLTIPPAGLTVLEFASGFLPNGGAEVRLIDGQGRTMEQVVRYPELATGVVYAATHEGANEWRDDYPPSPGASNQPGSPTPTTSRSTEDEAGEQTTTLASEEVGGQVASIALFSAEELAHASVAPDDAPLLPEDAVAIATAQAVAVYVTAADGTNTIPLTVSYPLTASMNMAYAGRVGKPYQYRTNEMTSTDMITVSNISTTPEQFTPLRPYAVPAVAARDWNDNLWLMVGVLLIVVSIGSFYIALRQ